jgi:hypothetical protein
MKLAALITMSLLTLPAAAQSVRDDVMNGAERCAGIADDHVWLDCFYGSAQPMRGRLGLAPAPQAQVKLVPPPGPASMAAPPRRVVTAAPPPVRERGFFADILGSTGPVARNMPLAAYSFDRSGRFTATLQNGMTFVQKENDLVHAGWSGPSGALLATVNASGDDYTFKVKSDPGAVYHVRRK